MTDFSTAYLRPAAAVGVVAATRTSEYVTWEPVDARLPQSDVV